MSFKVSSVQEYFDTLDRRFSPEGAKGADMIFQWKLDGQFWHAEIKEGTMVLHEGAHPSPTCGIEMTGDNFVKMINGEINGQLALLTRKLKLSGNKIQAGRMRTMFPQV